MQRKRCDTIVWTSVLEAASPFLRGDFYHITIQLLVDISMVAFCVSTFHVG